MSKQRDILSKVVSSVREHIPDYPLYLSGSVALRHERSDSDIDLLVIVPDVAAAGFPGGQVEILEDDFKLVGVMFYDVPLHLHFASTTLLHMFEEHPWRAYKFLQMEMIHDSNRIVKRTMSTIAPWFDDHPDAVRLWKQWLAENKIRQLGGCNQLGPLLQHFPNEVPDFWNHLDGIYGDEIAEQANTADRKGAAGRGIQ